MESIFKKYYKRLARIAILKSICFSVMFGFCVNFLVALIMLFFDLSVAVELGVSIGAGVLAIGCAAPLLYCFKFKPTLNRMASALDEQGLEERMVTMVEFENDDSYIAKAQRENAVKKLESVNPKSLRFVLPTIAVVLISAAMILGISMTTVTALSAADVIQFPHKDVVEEDLEEPTKEPDEEVEMVSVLYEAGEHGRVDGELFQEFEKGGSATAVVAVPEEGYVFSFWSDGIFTAERQDQNVMSSFSVTAIFAKETVVGPEEEGGGQEGGNAGSGQQGGQQGGNAGSGQDGDGGDGEGEDGEGEGGGGASGSTAEDNNTVIDGNTDYHQEIDYEATRESILQDDTLSQEEKDMLLKYLDTLMEDSGDNP